ncbi:MAG: head GIN domain-containing protein [Marinifilaceae bacterium]
MKHLLLICISLFISIGAFSQKISKEFNLDKFRFLSVSSGFEVYISQGEEQSVKLEYDSNIEEYLKVGVVNNTLRISVENKSVFKRFKRSHIRKAFIVIKNLESVDISGGGSLNMDEFMLNDFKISLSGGGNINLNAESENLRCSLSGGGNINLKGRTRDLKLIISGGGDIFLKQQLDNARMSISGGGNANVFCVNANSIIARMTGGGAFNGKIKLSILDLKLSGGGSALLEGHVKNMNIGMSGGGDVEAKNFETEYCNIRLAGGGDAEVYASKKISVSVSGGGDIKCYGKPDEIIKRLSGGSKLKMIK